MKYNPILFSTAMVQAILDDRKTMTRRIIKHDDLLENPDKFRFVGDSRTINIFRPAIKYDDRIWFDWEYKNSNAYSFIERCKWKPGDVLWVRESFISGCEMEDGYFKHDEHGNTITKTWYKADGDLNQWYTGDSDFPVENIPWKPSIHMPKSACRIFLEVASVRVERLQDISIDDAVKEGIEPITHPPYNDVKKWGWRFKDYIGNSVCLPVASFQTLWQSINGPASWDANPWVWVVEFKRIDKPENFN
jgi:hypothetical protein